MKTWVLALIIFLAVDLFLVIWIVIKRSKKKKLGNQQMNYIKSHWIRIIDSFEHDPKHAILDGDKLLDYALKAHGYQGNLGTKLKKAKNRFTDLNGVWMAHKLRNKIAHELVDLDMREARRALKHFKKALNDLGAEL